MSQNFPNITAAQEEQLWAAVDAQLSEQGMRHAREGGVLKVFLSDGSFVRRSMEDIAERAAASEDFSATVKDLVAGALAPLNSIVLDPTTLDDELFTSSLRVRLSNTLEFDKSASYSATAKEHGLNLARTLTLDHSGMTTPLNDSQVENRAPVAELLETATAATNAALKNATFTRDSGVKGKDGTELFAMFTSQHSLASSVVFDPATTLPEAGVNVEDGFLWAVPTPDVVVFAPLHTNQDIFAEAVVTMSQYVTASFAEGTDKVSPCVYVTKGEAVETIAFPANSPDGKSMVVGLHAPTGSVSAQYLGKATS